MPVEQGQPTPDTQQMVDYSASQPDLQPSPESDDAGGEGVNVNPQGVVGDSRRLKAIGLSADYSPGGVVLGDAWQDQDGELHGTGIFAVMLFEPSARMLYKNSSISFDMSPLELLYMRLSRSSFVRVELKEENNV